MENKRIFGRICCLQRYMCRENNVLFTEYGITPIQMDTLIFVLIKNKNGVQVCQRDVERFLSLRASSVSTLISKLCNKGYMNRAVADGDARTKYISLTNDGVEICKKHKILMDKCDSIVQSALTEEEQETFISLLNKISNACGKEVK